ncbi:GNAT family N-acetyltransferase [Goodfellowiella coeruleoviolacea]|uniref:Acetyltransferase (GNAT) family protein n=1 Tax=Goodfellowiella coeruleoviolacea TaxID=334858 RepID=A0AAE3GJ98_9PSEU|nr:GNAT family N-acetyltransferase [Goodfellowiella coeruleoviolacea]MCP2169241.1 Acetyltransferase (GNAT) family protein [Goodfellowiella coeruleoviolacea]
MGVTVRVRDLVPADEPAVLHLFASCADWFTAATGQPSGPGDVQSLYYALPPGCDPDQKRLLVLEVHGEVVGCVDAVVGHPDDRSCAVGCYLVAPEWRRQGIGGAVARALIERTPGIDRVTATLAPDWVPGAEFLRSLGFRIADAGGVSVGNRNAAAVERASRRAELDVRSLRPDSGQRVHVDVVG